jgi:7,8-dihydroneopterin aldolase/epimerase/oxygenase
MGEFTIELRNLEFYSFHGLYEEEKRIGGEFVVDVWAKFPDQGRMLTSIDETANYAALFAVIKKEMDQPRELLESLAQSICEKIHTQYSFLQRIEIKIEKKKAPITGLTGNVAVLYKADYIK